MCDHQHDQGDRRCRGIFEEEMMLEEQNAMPLLAHPVVNRQPPEQSLAG